MSFLFDPSKITWRCEVCREERPDAKISVYKAKVNMSGVEVDRNVKFCNDREGCIEGAPGVAKSFAEQVGATIVTTNATED